MEYRTVFDIATAGFKSWDFPAFGLPFIAIGILLVANRKNLPSWWYKGPKERAVFPFVFLGLALLWTLFTFASTYTEYRSLASSVGKAQVVEGLVRNFKGMPPNGHGMETFCVSRACFEYSDYSIVAGFNNTATRGGPIREGRPVRITYVGNSILKLEIAK
ncbi:MAG: hypothetical protein V4582_09520 [Pseudomonadota bacterium]